MKLGYFNCSLHNSLLLQTFSNSSNHYTITLHPRNRYSCSPTGMPFKNLSRKCFMHINLMIFKNFHRDNFQTVQMYSMFQIYFPRLQNPRSQRKKEYFRKFTTSSMACTAHPTSILWIFIFEVNKNKCINQCSAYDLISRHDVAVMHSGQ